MIVARSKVTSNIAFAFCIPSVCKQICGGTGKGSETIGLLPGRLRPVSLRRRRYRLTERQPRLHLERKQHSWRKSTAVTPTIHGYTFENWSLMNESEVIMSSKE